MSKRDAIDIWRDDILPTVTRWERRSNGGRVSRKRRAQSWRLLTHAMAANGDITPRKAEAWAAADVPKACYEVAA